MGGVLVSAVGWTCKFMSWGLSIAVGVTTLWGKLSMTDIGVWMKLVYTNGQITEGTADTTRINKVKPRSGKTFIGNAKFGSRLYTSIKDFHTNIHLISFHSLTHIRNHTRPS
jgi:hypothetical protein